MYTHTIYLHKEKTYCLCVYLFINYYIMKQWLRKILVAFIFNDTVGAVDSLPVMRKEIEILRTQISFLKQRNK